MQTLAHFKRGINLGGWLSQCNNQKEHYDSFITEKDIERIASWGLDHVRLPFDYELIQNEDGSFKEDGFAYLDSAVSWCQKHGLNIVLDLHKAAGYSFNDYINAGGNKGTAFFKDSQLTDKFLKLWMAISMRYKGYEDILAFDLLNEVVDKDSFSWNALVSRTISAIRKIMPNVAILVGGIDWNSINTMKFLDAPFDDNTAYTFHFYDPMPFTHQKAYWMDKMPKDITTEYPGDIEHYRKIGCAIGQGAEKQLSYPGNLIDINYIDFLLRDAAVLSKSRNAALYCGEYGVIDRAPLDSTLRWYQDFHYLMESYGIGRAAWSYKAMDFGIIDKHYKPIFDDLIKLL